MRRIINKILFAFRFAYKNIIHDKIRSLMILFSFVAFFVVLLLGFSNRDFFNRYYYDELEQKFQHIDFQMTTSENNQIRFFSIANLNQMNLEGVIESYVPFFEIQTLLELPNNDFTNVKVMASTLNHLKTVSNQSFYPGNELLNDEIIITRSFANQHGLKLGHLVELHAGRASKSFYIVEIVADGKLFQGDSVYLNKDASLSFFLEAINPQYAGISPHLFANIYNKVYFELADGSSYEDAEALLTLDPQYDQLRFSSVINHDAINQNINRNVSVFNILLFIVLFSIFLVLQTTFLLYFNDKQKIVATLKMIGGSYTYAFFIFCIELMLFLLISLLLSQWFAYLILKEGIRLLNSSLVYQIPFSSIAYAFIVALLLCIVTIFYYTNQFKKRSLVEQRKTDRVSKKSHFKLYLLSLCMSLLIFALFSFPRINIILSNYVSVFLIFLSVVIMFLIALVFINLFFARKKVSTFMLYMKMLVSKRTFFQYISIIMISFLSILLLVTGNRYMHERKENIESEIQIDFMLFNFSHLFNETYEKMNTLEGVEHASKVLLYQNIELVDFDENIRFLVSLDKNELQHYFSIPLNESLNSLDRDDKLVILLPERFHYIYQIEKGDLIRLSLFPSEADVIFEVSGFFENQLGSLALTNIHLIEEDDQLKYNAIFVNGNTDHNVLKQQLILNFSQQLIVIFDFNTYIRTFVSDLNTVINYLTFILSIMVFSFILSILNHSAILRQQMKNDFAHMSVLGFRKKLLRYLVIKENTVLFSIFAFSSFIGFILLSTQLTTFSILFKEYEKMTIHFESLINGFIIILMVFVFVKGLYVHSLRKIEISDFIKLND